MSSSGGKEPNITTTIQSNIIYDMSYIINYTINHYKELIKQFNIVIDKNIEDLNQTEIKQLLQLNQDNETKFDKIQIEGYKLLCLLAMIKYSKLFYSSFIYNEKDVDVLNRMFSTPIVHLFQLKMKTHLLNIIIRC
jgi:hypothetical protein